MTEVIEEQLELLKHNVQQAWARFREEKAKFKHRVQTGKLLGLSDRLDALSNFLEFAKPQYPSSQQPLIFTERSEFRTSYAEILLNEAKVKVVVLQCPAGQADVYSLANYTASLVHAALNLQKDRLVAFDVHHRCAAEGRPGQRCPPGPPTPGTVAALCSALQSLHVATLVYATDVAKRVDLFACGGVVAIEYMQPGIDRVKLNNSDAIIKEGRWEAAVDSSLVREEWQEIAAACQVVNFPHPTAWTKTFLVVCAAILVRIAAALADSGLRRRLEKVVADRWQRRLPFNPWDKFKECLGLAELGKTDELLRLAEEQEVRWADGREKRRIADAAEDYRDYTEKEDTAITAAQKELSQRYCISWESQRRGFEVYVFPEGLDGPRRRCRTALYASRASAVEAAKKLLQAYDDHSAARQAGRPDSVPHPDTVAKSLQTRYSSVFKGVINNYDSNATFRATIPSYHLEGKRSSYLGNTHGSELEAARASDRGQLLVHGRQAKLNFHRSWEDFKDELAYHESTMSREDLTTKAKNKAILKRLNELQAQYKATGTSIYRGVSHVKGTDKYQANLSIDRTRCYIGEWEDELEAARQVDRFEVRLAGRERENKLNFCSVEHYAEELKEHDILCSQFPDAGKRASHLSAQLKEERKAPGTIRSVRKDPKSGRYLVHLYLRPLKKDFWLGTYNTENLACQVADKFETRVLGLEGWEKRLPDNDYTPQVLEHTELLEKFPDLKERADAAKATAQVEEGQGGPSGRGRRRRGSSPSGQPGPAPREDTPEEDASEEAEEESDQEDDIRDSHRGRSNSDPGQPGPAPQEDASEEAEEEESDPEDDTSDSHRGRGNSDPGQPSPAAQEDTSEAAEGEPALDDDTREDTAEEHPTAAVPVVEGEAEELESRSTSVSEDVEEPLSSRRPRRHKVASREKREADATEQAFRELDDSEADSEPSEENSSDLDFQPVKKSPRTMEGP